MANHLAKPSKDRVRTSWRWGTALMLVCIIVSAYFVLTNQHVAPTSADQSTVTMSPIVPSAKATPAETPTAMPTSTPTSSPRTEADPVVAAPSVASAPVVPIPLKADPVRIEIPSARIDLRILPLPASSIQGGVLTPPNDSNAYSVDPVDHYDQPGADSVDMTLIVAHSCDGLAVCQQMDWQFNRLSDPNLVKAGTDVAVHTKNGKVCYKVDQDTITYDKYSFNKEIEAHVFGTAPRPGKLVLVSCYTADVHAKNVAAVASLVSCDS